MWARTYLIESGMLRIRKIPILALLVVVSFIAVQAFAASQTVETLQPGFGQAIVAVHSAEMAGATPSDISDLVSLLNKALEMNQEAQQPNTPADERAQLIAQVNQTLATVQTKAVDLTSIYQERTSMDRIVAYIVGAAIALLGTILYEFAVVFYQRYRVGRTFDMRVKRK